jgi:5-formyltetrahydrofolate cyclo-ligase
MHQENMDKNTVRTLVKEKISKLNLKEKKNENLEVSKKLITLLSEKDFKTLVTYTAFEDEIDISEVELW